jgi:hypothetical protein
VSHLFPSALRSWPTCALRATISRIALSAPIRLLVFSKSVAIDSSSMAMANLSNGSIIGFGVMDADTIDYNFSSNQAAHSGLKPTANNDCVEHELIPPTSRISRLPVKVSSITNPCTSSSPTSAISALQNTATNTVQSQDVRYSVNTTSVRSPVINTKAPASDTIQSFSQPLTQHDLKHPIRRPWTSTQVFQSSTDLAAHYGIPQRLPPAPTTNSRPQAAASTSTPQLTDFTTLRQNYISMLSNKPVENTTVTSPVMMAQATFAELNAPVVPSEAETLDQIAAMLGMETIPIIMTHLSTALAASPEFRDLTYMTSPMPGLEQDFGVSPEETPYHDFLTTPLIGYDDALVTSPLLMDNMSLIPYSDADNFEDSSVPKPRIDFSTTALQTISPYSPAVDSFDDMHVYPSVPQSSTTVPALPSSTPVPAPRRVSKAIGIRKGITPDALLDESAPTQSRTYVTPSATSRKEIPATFARKRARSAAFGDEEDELDDVPLDDNERELIEAKRRKNTEAARKSRKRKLLLYQNLEKARDEERNLKEVWKERALMTLSTLREHGINYPDFPEDVQQYAHI